MTIEADSNDEGFDLVRAGAGAVLAAGLALLGWATYTHLTIAAQVRAGQCDGCAPWHPILILAPMGLGASLLLAGGFVLQRR